MAMKRTLLELTQDILASLDGDEVTDIADTAESAQVANIIRQNFYEIAANHELPEHNSMFELTETSSSSPTVMTKPTDVMNISWIKYDYIDTGETDPSYQEIYFLPWNDLLSMLNALDTTETTVSSFNYTIGSDTFPIKYINNRPPMYYSTYNDGTIVFDSVDVVVEAFLRKSKTECWGLKEQTWTHTNAGVPALDHRLSNLLFQRSKAQCFLELKQVESAQTERKARKAELTLNRKKHDINNDYRGDYWDPKKLPNYGRR